MKGLSITTFISRMIVFLYNIPIYSKGNVKIKAVKIANKSAFNLTIFYFNSLFIISHLVVEPSSVIAINHDTEFNDLLTLITAHTHTSHFCNRCLLLMPAD